MGLRRLLNFIKITTIENLKIIDGHFVLVWDILATCIHNLIGGNQTQNLQPHTWTPNNFRKTILKIIISLPMTNFEREFPEFLWAAVINGAKVSWVLEKYLLKSMEDGQAMPWIYWSYTWKQLDPSSLIYGSSD